MSKSIRSQQDVLKKLNIEKLNPMQMEAGKVFNDDSDIMLLSPTGTGKTLAFLLPIIEQLDAASSEIQVLILVPSRELALQIEQVGREMGTGHKINAVYGGRAGSKDKVDLKHRPAILIGTPGRIADHLRRETFPSTHIHTLVLDEFDKSLEIGFEEDMSEIMDFLPNVKKRILTSATQDVKIPDFVGLKRPTVIDYLHEGNPQLQVKAIQSAANEKLQTLVKMLHHIGNHPGIIFCNFKDTIQQVSDFLTFKNVSHGCFYGGMEQLDRERALIKFRNGTHQVLVATDLAARGIDVPEIKFIIHYQLPPRSKEFTHRNGRTARMNKDGTAYILKEEKQNFPDFIRNIEIIEPNGTPKSSATNWETLYITGGRRDKISKGDIVGLFLKQGNLGKDQLGIIEVKHDCAYVGVHASKVKEVIQVLNNTKLKKKKVRISLL